MRSASYLSLATVMLLVACGDDSTLFSNPDSGGSAAGGTKGLAGSSTAGTDNGDAGEATDPGGGGSGNGGSSSGGTGASAGDSGNAGAGGGNGGGAGDPGGGMGGGGMAGMGGTGGGGMGGSGGAAPTCPGTQVGCVVDWAGKFGTAASASKDGIGAAAVFGGNDAARALTGDDTYLYVAGSNCIRRVHLVTAAVETILGQCGSPGYANMAGAQARFGALDGMVHSAGKLWINDAGNFVIREIDLSNMAVSTLSGSPGNNGFQSGSAGMSRYDSMLGMTLITHNLFITEGAGNDDVRHIDNSNGTSSLVAGGNGAGNQNGAGNVAEFSSARKIGTNGTDLFVVDTENNRVRRIVLGGGTASSNTVSTFVGSTAGFMDATGTSAQLRRPRGISFNGSDFYLADSDNCVVRKITVPGGVVTTIAGKYLAGGCANHTEGLGTAAEFNKPLDIYFDAGSGDLFISEGTVIRRMYL